MHILLGLPGILLFMIGVVDLLSTVARTPTAMTLSLLVILCGVVLCLLAVLAYKHNAAVT